MTALRLLNLQGIVGIIVGAALGVLLLLQHGETRHWHKQSDRFEQLYNGADRALKQTVINYQAAAEQARQADAENIKRVVGEQQAVNQERYASYEARIADARARAQRVLNDAQAHAHPGGPGAAALPAPGAPAGGPSGPAPQTGLSRDDALIATEQAIQLDELEKWVWQQLGVDLAGQK